MKITEILTDIKIPDSIKDADVSALSASPQGIDEGTLFFLTEGVNYEKQRLLPFILAKKPIAVVTSDKNAVKDACVPILYAENARAAFAEAYFRFCGLDKSKMQYVAVTGTNGKTTTATMLYEILHAEGIKTGFIGTGRMHINGKTLSSPYYSMTTPDPEILYPALKEMDKAGCRAVVMEASSHALKLHKLSPLSFDIAIFTNLSEEHLDFHANMEDYYLAKRSLFRRAKHAVLNADDPYARRLAYECPCPVTRIGALFEGDVMAKSIEPRENGGFSYIYKTEGPTFSVDLKLCGTYQIYNSMLALCAAIRLGIPPYRARRAIERLDTVAGRLECIAKEPIAVYLDYAHTPNALLSTLKNLCDIRTEEKKIWTVFGCGGERDRSKRPKMASIAERLSDQVILTLDNCREESPMQILHDTVQGFQNPKSMRIVSNREKAIRYAVHAAADSDILLIAGKGHEDYTIDKDGYHPFDERKIVLDALKERKGGHTLLYENQTDKALHGKGD
ncbi:MAG: UDP-N-acetylmuramoyl-L-alanyl-D-glutamate--2,6-diaminopimelate ligase [Clostridia bacterium]|nr:UDP-N-acetylmuramoyl-L-alanyl-D-glutamate--2,6-diaminopimelate ligase [Clostridia bacterium]